MSETSKDLFARYGPRYRAYVTVTALLGTIAAVLTTTTVNVALPDIMGSFGIGQDRVQWLATGALAGMTVGQLLNAWLVDSFGQRKTFVGALCVFVAALVLAGVSPNVVVLTLARVVQGVIAGVTQSLAMFTLFSVFPPERRGTAMGFFSVTVILGPALGPTLGGVLIEHFNWRYVFYMALPVSAAGILLGSLFMPEREETVKRADFDWFGFLLLSATMSCLLLGLSNGQREGWHSDFVLGLLALAGGAGIGFLVWEWRVAQPLVDLRVLANGQFAAIAIVSWIFGLGLFGTIYLIPLFVQSIQGYTPLAAGLLLMPSGLLLGLFMLIGGYLSDRLPARTLIVFGLLTFAASTYWMGGVDANTSFWLMLWWLVVGRIGQAVLNPTLNVAALRALRPAQVRQGAGMINFSRQLGGAFGVNLLSILLDRRTYFYGDIMASAQTAANSSTAELLRTIERLLAQAGAPPELQSAGALDYLGRVLYAQAYTMAFRDSFLVVTLAFVLALIPAWIIGRRTGRS